MRMRKVIELYCIPKSPELDKDFSVTVTMAGAGNTRYDPQITVEEVAQ